MNGQRIPKERRAHTRLSDDLREHHDKLFTLIRALQEENALLRGKLASERVERVLLGQAQRILGIE